MNIHSFTLRTFTNIHHIALNEVKIRKNIFKRCWNIILKINENYLFADINTNHNNIHTARVRTMNKIYDLKLLLINVNYSNKYKYQFKFKTIIIKPILFYTYDPIPSKLL